jgi:O-antigen/teichoic acid export membrane protein
LSIREQIIRARHYVTGTGLGPLLVRAVAGSGLVQLVAMVGTFVVGIQLARGLGPATYGRYGIALAIVTLMMVPGSLGTPKFVTREVASALALKDWPRLFGVIRWANRTCIVASLVVSVVTVAIAAGLARHSRETSIAILVGTPTILLLTLATVRTGALQGLHEVVRGQIPTFLVRPLVFSALLFLLFRIHPHADSAEAMGAYCLTSVASLAVADIWLRRYLPKERPAGVAQEGRRWLRSSIPMGMTDGLQVLQGQLSILVLGAIAVPAQVGLFRIALSIYVATAVPTTFLAIAVGPTIARLHSKSDDRLQKVLSRAAQVQFGSVLLICLPLLAFPGTILGFVFGRDYALSAAALTVLLLGQLINAGFGLNSQLLNMTGHERRLTEATVIGVATNVVVTWALTARMGAVGAALGTTISMLTWNAIASFQAWKRLGMNTSAIQGRKSSVRASPPQAS